MAICGSRRAAGNPTPTLYRPLSCETGKKANRGVGGGKSRAGEGGDDLDHTPSRHAAAPPLPAAVGCVG